MAFGPCTPCTTSASREGEEGVDETSGPGFSVEQHVALISKNRELFLALPHVLHASALTPPSLPHIATSLVCPITCSWAEGLGLVSPVGMILTPLY